VDRFNKVSIVFDGNIFSLMYIASFTLQSTIDMTINNYCSNIELTYPIYFIEDETCHVQFPQKVNSRSIMKINFIINIYRGMFGGVLLYRLQRKENTSISTQLLVIWGYKSNKPYLHTLLIEHDSALTWNKDKLERLYHIYDNQYARFFVTNMNIWSLDDNTKLQTFHLSSHGGFEMNIIISEERNQFLPQKPLWADPDRYVPTVDNILY
jgi:hypothetical protein